MQKEEGRAGGREEGGERGCGTVWTRGGAGFLFGPQPISDRKEGGRGRALAMKDARCHASLVGGWVGGWVGVWAGGWVGG